MESSFMLIVIHNNNSNDCSESFRDTILPSASHYYLERHPFSRRETSHHEISIIIWWNPFVYPAFGSDLIHFLGGSLSI